MNSLCLILTVACEVKVFDLKGFKQIRIKLKT